MAVKDIFNSLSTGALMQGSRSTVLTSLGWMAASLMSAMTLGSFAGAPEWMLFLFATCFVLDFALFLGAFVYFGIKDRDALRSERYGIQKLQIQGNRVGDSESGFGLQIEATATSNPNLVLEGDK